MVRRLRRFGFGFPLAACLFVLPRAARAEVLVADGAHRSCRAVAPPSPTRLKRFIKSWLGTPYQLGQDQKGLGTDCSGFIQKLYQEGFGMKLPRTSRAQAAVGAPVLASSLEPGDLVFFGLQDAGEIDHVGIYVGANRFVHASATHGVRYSSLSADYYKRGFQGARRVRPIRRCS